MLIVTLDDCGSYNICVCFIVYTVTYRFSKHDVDERFVLYDITRFVQKDNKQSTWREPCSPLVRGGTAFYYTGRSTDINDWQWKNVLLSWAQHAGWRAVMSQRDEVFPHADAVFSSCSIPHFKWDTSVHTEIYDATWSPNVKMRPDERQTKVGNKMFDSLLVFLVSNSSFSLLFSCSLEIQDDRRRVERD